MKENEALIEALQDIKQVLERIDSTLFDTLGSYEAGQALKAIPDIADSLTDIASKLEDE